MIPTLEALESWKANEGYYSLDCGNGIEVCLEQLIFDEQWYLAVYKDQNLIAEKICVKIGYKKSDE